MREKEQRRGQRGAETSPWGQEWWERKREGERERGARETHIWGGA